MFRSVKLRKRMTSLSFRAVVSSGIQGGGEGMILKKTFQLSNILILNINEEYSCVSYNIITFCD